MTSSNGNIFRVTGYLCGNSPHKGQWGGALILSLICVWINGSVNNCEAGDLRRYHAHYDISVMIKDMSMHWQQRLEGVWFHLLLPYLFKGLIRPTIKTLSILHNALHLSGYSAIVTNEWVIISIWVKSQKCSCLVTWFCYHHFVAIGKFKLVLQSGNAQFGSKSTIFCPMWPWNLTDDLQQGKSEGFESCDLPIVRKRPIWVKIGDVLYRVTLKFDGWPWKTIGHLSFAVSSFVQHFIAIGEFKLELQSRNAQFGSNSTIFRAVWPWNLTYDLEKQ